MTASYDFDRAQPADARGGVKEALDHLDASVSVLVEMTSTLADKLELVLRPSVPRGMPGDDEKAKSAVFDTSPAQEHVRRTIDQIQGVTAKLHDFIERLET